MSTVIKALWIALVMSVGFLIPDFVEGTFDRADVAAPMMAFCTALLTLMFYGKDK